MGRRLESKDLVARAAMWIATLHDDASELELSSRDERRPAAERLGLKKLSRTLSGAAAIVESLLPEEEPRAFRLPRKSRAR